MNNDQPTGTPRNIITSQNISAMYTELEPNFTYSVMRNTLYHSGNVNKMPNKMTALIMKNVAGK